MARSRTWRGSDDSPTLPLAISRHGTGRPSATAVRPTTTFSAMNELSGTRVMVTGATSGLGAAMSAALSAAGARVIATSRQPARAQAAARQLGPDAVGLTRVMA